VTDTNVLKMIDLYRDASASTDELRRRTDETMLAIVAGETVTVLGRRARFTVEWVDTPPWGTPEETTVRIAESLAKIRGTNL
jgi:hypothetical protein